MSDASDMQHHLEEGLLHFTRGSVFEARQSWRKVIQIDPSNEDARDYLESTVRELNAYERRLEDEALTSQATRPASLDWEDDSQIIEAESEEEDSPAASTEGASLTGFLVEDGGEVEAGTDDGDEDWDLPPPPVVEEDGDALEADLVGIAGRRAGDGEHEAEAWEPLDWVNEITPAVPLHGLKRGEGARRPMKPPAASLSSPEEQLRQARARLDEGRPDLARDLLLKVMEVQPELPGAVETLEEAITAMLERYSEVLGDNSGVPELNPRATDLFSLNLDEVGGYVLSRIDGILTLDDIYTLSAHIDRLMVMRILVDLVKSGAISIRH